MKKTLFVFLAIFSSIVFTACPNSKKGIFGAPPRQDGLVTGECYDSIVLYHPTGRAESVVHSMHGVINSYGVPQKGASFEENKSFLEIYIIFEKPKIDFEDVNGVSTMIPAPEAFNQFGPDAEKVRKYFIDLCGQIDFGESRSGRIYFCLYYTNGLKLTADKYFAGRNPGEDLSDIIYILSMPARKVQIPGVETPDHFKQLDGGLTLYFPIEGFELVDEEVTFNITLPIKLGMCLNWINDLLTDPNAEYQYKDVVLTGTFTIKKGLH